MHTYISVNFFFFFLSTTQIQLKTILSYFTKGVKQFEETRARQLNKLYYVEQ